MRSRLPAISDRWLYLALLLVGMATAVAIAFFPFPWQLLPLALVIGSVFTFVIVRHPEWVIYFLIIYIPFEEFIEKWIPTGPLYEVARYGPEALLFLLLLLVILEKARGGFRWYSTPLDKPLILFGLVALLSGLLNPAPLPVWVLGIRPLLRYVAVFYIITQLRITPKSFERCLSLALIVATIVASIGLLQTIIGNPLTNILIPKDVVVGDVTVRAGLRHGLSARTYIFATMGRYDTLGVFLAIFLLLTYGIQGFVRGVWRRKIYLFWVVAVPAFLLTFSRQSWLGFLVGVTYILLMSSRRHFTKTRFFYFFGAILLILSLLWLAPNAVYFGSDTESATFVQRLTEPFAARYLDVSRNHYGRLYVILEVPPRILQQAPLLGFGPGQFGSITAQYFNISFGPLVGVPDSSASFINDVNWVVILGQYGVVGLFAFVWMLLGVWRLSFRLYRLSPEPVVKGFALGYAACIIVFFLLGFFGPNFEVRQSSFYLWLWGGMVTTLYWEQKKDLGL